MQHSAVWINEKFTLIKNIFRQINSLVTCLVKPLLSRNFYKNAWERISVISTLCTAVLCTIFSEKIREINVLLKNFNLNWFDEKKIAWQWISRFSTLCKVNLTTFCKSSVKSKRIIWLVKIDFTRNQTHCTVEDWKIYMTFATSLWRTLFSRNFYKIVREKISVISTPHYAFWKVNLCSAIL